MAYIGFNFRCKPFYYLFRSISLAPVEHMLCRLATAYAGVGELLLLKRDTA